jgi:hypothetical protein
MGIHAPMHPATRAAIEAQIEHLIGLLDLMDGDCDLEDATDMEDDFSLTAYALAFVEGRGPGCEISDAGGGNVEDEPQMGRGQDYFSLFPVYGIDQTKGPINEGQAYRQHRREMGCVDD